MFTYEDNNYTAINNKDNSFKNPRQKMWGVFVRPDNQIYSTYWSLVKITDNIKEAKNKVKDWLSDPPNINKVGIDNVIIIEIIPVDSQII